MYNFNLEPIGKSKDKPESHSRGQKYRFVSRIDGKQTFILAMVNREFALVNIQSGEFWSSPVYFKRTDYLTGISQNQFIKLLGGKQFLNLFKKVQK